MLKNEIHELIITDEKNAGPRKKVNNISYLVFVRIEEGGIVAIGDKVYLEGKIIGEVAGFDETHISNHWNIVIKSSKKAIGIELNAPIEGEIPLVKKNKKYYKEEVLEWLIYLQTMLD
ncbi:hypothetical protein CVT91_03555 [Candidatus Atribacteria bacterium HGW-Atribacteria-1]|nr:MAG: hypothetical protein CVT91_03555 [Candidatus Atribacteria bacterium HGW-Atribacteria-1]